MNKQKTLREIIKIALVAAIYVALTLVLYPLSYGAIQFRLSEFLMILICYNPLYSISLIIGCLLANIASPMGALDVIFGTLATALSCIPMIFLRKNKYLASLMPSIVNAIVIGLELQYAYAVPFYLGAIEVFIGEFVVVSLVGVPVFKALEKNEKVVELLDFSKDNKESKLDKVLNSKILFSIALFIIGLVLFFRLGLYYVGSDEEGYETYSLFNYTFGYNVKTQVSFLIIIATIPLLTLLSTVLLKNKASFIINTILNVIGIILLILGIVVLNKYIDAIDSRFYTYFILFIISFVIDFLFFIKNNKNDIVIEDSNQYESLN